MAYSLKMMFFILVNSVEEACNEISRKHGKMLVASGK